MKGWCDRIIEHLKGDYDITMYQLIAEADEAIEERDRYKDRYKKTQAVLEMTQIERERDRKALEEVVDICNRVEAGLGWRERVERASEVAARALEGEDDGLLTDAGLKIDGN